MSDYAQFSVVPIEVVKDPRLTLEQTRVLVVLFSFRNKTTNTVWPSRASIAERTGMHISNISSATTSLAALGWLTKEGLGGHSKATRYTLCVPDLPGTTVADSATVARSATVAESATRPLAESATGKEQSIEQSIEQKGETRMRAPTFDLPDWINQAHWDTWHSCPKRRKTTDQQKQMAVDKLDRWRREGLDHAEALESAALAGWQGLFKPDQQAAGQRAGSGETAYQRSMRLRIEEAAPGLARKDPSAAARPADFLEAIEVQTRTVGRFQ
jgi:hypothetical protein